MKTPGCPLCEGPGGVLVFQGPLFRLIRAEEAGFPAFYRVVWNGHVKEFSDLPADQRRLCMEAVTQVEEGLRAHLDPVKVNLATLGNAVAHLHWHVIARFAWDSHFPGSVWAQALREAPADAIAAIEALRPALEKDLASRLAALAANRTGS
jgi:diadenosine tetraphosphate (Ap4A) HIT family hydrolase